MTQQVHTQKADARVEAQRLRILTAAQHCFVEQGFHSASMATIAETAQMSAGLIYRYFKSKNEIILAIIASELRAARTEIGQLHTATDLVTELLEHFEQQVMPDSDSMNAALSLEMSAEATREPQIAAALRDFDAAVRSDIAAWLSRSKEQGGCGLPAEIASARALMLICVIEGMHVRAVREPAIDRTLLAEGLAEILPMLLRPPG